MSRKSYQKVTLSVELTLPPGAKAKDAPQFLVNAIGYYLNADKSEQAPLFDLDLNLAIIRILRRETIYTN